MKVVNMVNNINIIFLFSKPKNIQWKYSGVGESKDIETTEGAEGTEYRNVSYRGGVERHVMKIKCY